ncbi:hypothetical protein [Methylobacterium nonmethylotrophicum]|uniref:Uncharacterized protein n=1 Tax=Methylobacterium nonmethylotrophicum TaxID=1141884 RepID=A0A4Z0NZU3_9HYPH|nr:hypothetical protein [Methylobacterium nonmethylotrophicum]TGE02542.1 hypothetical protein EU555_01900 [Methylobacterium nonmethylotrophicum]
MRVGMHRSVGLALVIGLLCAPAARAQDQAAPGGRPWSDPPAKPAEAPAAEVKTPAPPVPAAKPARIAATPARTAPRQRSAERSAPVRRAAAFRRERVASRPVRRSVVAAPPRAAFRPAEPRPVRFARPLPPPDLHGDRDIDLWVDARADRIRRARDGGFLVMRRTTIEDPMGRRMQILRPFDDEDE